MTKPAGLFHLILLATLGTQPVAAQEAGAIVEYHSLAACDAMPGIALFAYQDIDATTGSNQYVFSDTCYDEASGTYIGAEVMEGLEPAQMYGPFSARLEVIADADATASRRILNVDPVMRADMEGILPTADIIQTTGLYPWQLISARPGMEQLQIFGWQWSAAAQQAGAALATLPDGFFGVSILVEQDQRRTGAIFEAGAVFWAEEPFLFEVVDGEMIYRGARPFAPPARINLSAANGVLTGSYAMDGENQTLPAARASDEFDTATGEITEIFGRVLQIDGEVIAVGMGAGRTIFRTEEGDEGIHDAWGRIVVQQLPAAFTQDMLREWFEWVDE